MAQDRDLPTAAADLKITTHPAQLKIKGPGGGLTASVPHTEARHLITTAGIAGCVAVSTGGAVWVLRSSPALGVHAAVYVTLGVLALGLVAVVLIAIGGAQRAGRTPTPKQDGGKASSHPKREALPRRAAS